MSDYKRKYNNKYNGKDTGKEKTRERFSEPMHDVEDEHSGTVIGRNAVRELLKSGRAIDKILVKKGEHEGSVTVLVAEAISRGIPVLEVGRIHKVGELSVCADACFDGR